ncbi:MAG: glycosyltransferase family 2 protein [Deltaproteobacteria bacterium]|nr:glycosyltransferase family 2 protein [Deltaproteobacteria bacterium]
MNYLIIIPAYNEERYILDLLTNLKTVAKGVVVVDDGSMDSTAAIATAAGAHVISRPHKGKGAALKTGFRYALDNGYDWVITMDSDGQHDWQDVPRFLDAMSLNGSGGDIYVGSRMDEAVKMPLLRRAANRFMSGLISRLVGCSISDTQCGFRAIKAKVLANVRLETSHYDTESELIIKSGKAGYSIRSIPIKTIYNGAPSNINKFIDTARFIKLLCMVL